MLYLKFGLTLFLYSYMDILCAQSCHWEAKTTLAHKMLMIMKIDLIRHQNVGLTGGKHVRSSIIHVFLSQNIIHIVAY